MAGDWLRLGTLALLGLALLWFLIALARVALPGRIEAMRRVELVSGLPHRPARGLTDKISRVADDASARALWAADQARLRASLNALRAGTPKPEMAARDPIGLRFAVPVLIALSFAVGWGEWTTRIGEAFSPVSVAPPAVAARIDAWIDPPAYTRQAPVFLSRRAGEAAATPVSVPEGSKLTVRIVSREPAEVSVETAAGAAPLAPDAEELPAGSVAASEETIRSYAALLDRDATLRIAHGGGAAAYPIAIVEDRPPTIARGPLTQTEAAPSPSPSMSPTITA